MIQGNKPGKWGRLNIKLIIVAAPSSVIFDQALPLVASLKALNPRLEILCLYPKPGSIIGARSGWTPVRLLEELGATSAYPITPSRWMSANSLSLQRKLPKIIAKASRLTFPYLYSWARFPRTLVSVMLLTLSWLTQGQTSRKIEALTKESNVVIWDSAFVEKEYMRPLLPLFREVPSYSIKHAIGLEKKTAGLHEPRKAPDRAISDRTTILAMARDEMPINNAVAQVSRAKILATGIYRHHPEWVRAFVSQEPEPREFEERDTLLVISRGFSSPNRYLPRKRMLDYVRDIKTVAEKFNLRLIVKPHPKETDLRIYAEAFGLASKGVSWDISDLHLAILARRAMFAVSFYSGSCVDLTAYGVPTIERLNLIGLPEWDFPSAIRDASGDPILEYRQHNLVLGASTSEQFFLQVEKVMRDRRKAMQELNKAYALQFICPPMSPSALAQKISDTCLHSSVEGEGFPQ